MQRLGFRCCETPSAYPPFVCFAVPPQYGVYEIRSVGVVRCQETAREIVGEVRVWKAVCTDSRAFHHDRGNKRWLLQECRRGLDWRVWLNGLGASCRYSLTPLRVPFYYRCPRLPL